MSEININYKYKKNKTSSLRLEKLGKPYRHTAFLQGSQLHLECWAWQLGLETHRNLEKKQHQSQLLIPLRHLFCVHLSCIWFKVCLMCRCLMTPFSKACLGLLRSTTDCSHLKRGKKEFGIPKFRTPEAETCRKYIGRTNWTLCTTFEIVLWNMFKPLNPNQLYMGMSQH